MGSTVWSDMRGAIAIVDNGVRRSLTFQSMVDQAAGFSSLEELLRRPEERIDSLIETALANTDNVRDIINRVSGTPIENDHAEVHLKLWRGSSRLGPVVSQRRLLQVMNGWNGKRVAAFCGFGELWALARAHSRPSSSKGWSRPRTASSPASTASRRLMKRRNKPCSGKKLSMSCGAFWGRVPFLQTEPVSTKVSRKGTGATDEEH